MATINVSEDQKKRFVATIPKIEKKVGTSLSQAQVFEIATGLLEERYTEKTQAGVR
jgi:hypothetical protein